jgi:S-adenosylmethionine synthetase
MAANGVNGTNGANGNGVSGWKHYNEGTFLFTVSSVCAGIAHGQR